MSWEATSVVTSRKQSSSSSSSIRHKTQDTRIRHMDLSATAAVPRYLLSTSTHPGPHLEPMGSDSDGGDYKYETLATLQAVAIATVHSTNTPQTLLLRARIC